MSTLQFSFTLAAKRHKSNEMVENESVLNRVTHVVFGTEIWSLFLVFLTQDFAFFILRIFILISYDLSKNYMIYFLVSKNFVLLILELYRIYAIYLEEKENKIEAMQVEDKKELSKKQNFTENADLKQRKSSDKLFSKNNITKA